MGKGLIKKPGGSGAVPGIASLFLPGLGQLINGENDKALGVFATWGIAGLSVIAAIPIVGWVGGLVAAGTHFYAVADGIITARRKR